MTTIINVLRDGFDIYDSNNDDDYSDVQAARLVNKQDLHAKFLRQCSTLVQRGMLICLVEVIERSELGLGMADARFFAGVARVHGSRVRVGCIGRRSKGRKLTGEGETVSHGGGGEEEKKASSTKSLTTV